MRALLAGSLGLVLSAQVPQPTYDPCHFAGSVNSAFVATLAGQTPDGTELRIEQWLHGEGPAKVTLEPSLCAFLPGQKYLVYAGPSWMRGYGAENALRGRLRCLEAKASEFAVAEMQELAAIRTGRTLVRGSVIEVSRDEPRPLSGAVVYLQAGRQSVHTTARRDGTFEIIGVAPGRYTVEVENPGHRPVYAVSPVVVPERGCTVVPPVPMQVWGVREQASFAWNYVLSVASRVAGLMP